MMAIFHFRLQKACLLPCFHVFAAYVQALYCPLALKFLITIPISLTDYRATQVRAFKKPEYFSFRHQTVCYLD